MFCCYLRHFANSNAFKYVILAFHDEKAHLLLIGFVMVILVLRYKNNSHC